MLGRRRRRRANFGPTLDRYVVLAGLYVKGNISLNKQPSGHETLNRCWLDVGPALQAMGQQ